MKYWFIIQNNQVGPVDKDQLDSINFDYNTPAWHDGLPQWTPARNIADLRIYLDNKTATTQPYGYQGQYAPDGRFEPISNGFSTQGQPNASSIPDESLRPANYLGWAIAATVLCNLIFGIIAIILAASVNTKFNRGDIEGAKKASENAQWCIIASIVIGVLWLPIQAIIALL